MHAGQFIVYMYQLMLGLVNKFRWLKAVDQSDALYMHVLMHVSSATNQEWIHYIPCHESGVDLLCPMPWIRSGSTVSHAMNQEWIHCVLKGSVVEITSQVHVNFKAFLKLLDVDIQIILFRIIVSGLFLLLTSGSRFKYHQIFLIFSVMIPWSFYNFVRLTTPFVL